MDKKCYVCGEKCSMFNSIKFADGTACKKCCKYIPKLVKNKSIKYLVDEACSLGIYEEIINDKNEVLVTSSYGKLHLDEIHGIIIFSDTVADDILSKCFDKFRILDIQEIDIYLVNPKVKNQSSVYADVEAYCRLRYPIEIDFKTKIKSNVFCPSKRNANKTLSWEEPGDLSIFRNMIYQCFENEKQKLERMLNESVPRIEIERYKARMALLLPEKYDRNILTEQKDKILKGFTTDSLFDRECVNKINYYYKILMEEF